MNVNDSSAVRLYRAVNAAIRQYKDQLVSAVWKQLVCDLTVTPNRDIRCGQNVFLSVKMAGHMLTIVIKGADDKQEVTFDVPVVAGFRAVPHYLRERSDEGTENM